MKALPAIACIVASLLNVLLAAPANATANYTYKKNEYVTVNGGLAPNKAYSIATSGEGDLGYDNFQVYLMREPGHKKVGPLTEIGEILDTAAYAYSARWSPDGNYVAILYRLDRRVIALKIYKIANGRAYILTGSTPLQAAGLIAELPTSTDESGQPEQRMRNLTLNWTGPKSFKLSEVGRIWVAPQTAVSLAKYGIINSNPEETNAPAALHEVQYKMTADCEIASGDTYRVTAVEADK